MSKIVEYCAECSYCLVTLRYGKIVHVECTAKDKTITIDDYQQGFIPDFCPLFEE